MKREVKIYSVKKSFLNRVRVTGIVLSRKDKKRGRYFNVSIAPERLIGVDVALDSNYNLYANISLFYKAKEIEVPLSYLQALHEDKKDFRSNLFSLFK